MISYDFLPFIFFVPNLIVWFFFIRYYIAYTKLYRKIINPDYPVAFGEGSKYLAKDPFKLILTAPLISLMRWQIIFEKHKDKKLNEAAQRVRGLFYLTLFFAFGLFLILVLLAYFGVFVYT